MDMSNKNAIKAGTDTSAPGGQDELAELTVPGMGSDHCAGIVSTSLRRLPGISEVHTNIANHHVQVGFDPALVNTAELRKAVERAGYEVAAVSDSGQSASVSGSPAGGARHGLRPLRGTGKGFPRTSAGVGKIRTNISNHQVVVERTADGPAPEALKAAVERAGYEVASVSTDAQAEEPDVEEAFLTRAWRRFVIAAVPTTLIMVLMIVHMFVAAVPGYLASSRCWHCPWCSCTAAGPPMSPPGVR
jgi:P-type Cu+ transporter